MTDLPVAKVRRVGAEQAREQGAAPALVLPLAPRVIPRRLVLRILFGTPIAKFGWLFAAFGLVVTLILLPSSENPFRSYDRSGMARITGVEETNSKEGKRRIYAVTFSFVDHAGIERRGESYTTEPEVGADAQVEYASDDPARARLVGMRAESLPFHVVVIVLIFPIAGIGLAFPQLLAGLRAVRLLRHGVETDGKVVSRKNTMKVNGAPIVALTFEYQVDGKTYTTTVKTLSPETLEDDVREKMLYDPYAPQRATTLDHLPGSPVVTKTGQIEAQPGSAGHLLIMPAVTLALIIGTAVVLAA